MKYEPGRLPELEDAGLSRFLLDELSRIAAAFEAVENVNLNVLHVEPTKPRNGMIVLADGSDWNPSDGAGFYGYSAGSWTFLG